MWHEFLHAVGADNMAGWQYGLFSGFLGSNLCPKPADVAIFWVIYRRLNCVEPKCRRIGVGLGADGRHRCHRHH